MANFLMQQPHRKRPALALLLCSGSAAFWLSACGTSAPVTENVPPPRIDQLGATSSAQLPNNGPQNMLDWAGTYQAVLPCEGCPGIAISVQLRENHTAVVRERRLGSDIEKASPEAYNGPFRFHAQGSSLITLSPPSAEPAYRFFVSEGWIEMRERTTGAPLPQQALFRLRKTSEPAR